MFIELEMNYSPLSLDRKDAAHLQMGYTACVNSIRECHKSPLRFSFKYESINDLAALWGFWPDGAVNR